MSNVNPETGPLDDTRQTEVHRLASTEWTIARALRVAALTDSPAAFGSSVERECGLALEEWQDRLSTNAWLVALSDDEPVGLVCGVRTSSPELIELTGMWVAPQHRGSGIADALVMAVLSWARVEGARRVQLEVAATNRHAVQLYARHGFIRIDGADAGRVEGRADDVAMVVDLDSIASVSYVISDLPDSGTADG